VLRYAIVDATVSPGHAARLASVGVDYIQLRAKSLSASGQLILARRLAAELTGTSTELLVNSRADIALAAHAHGVHLTSGALEITPQQIHELFSLRLSPGSSLRVPCVSVSCHNLSDIARALRTVSPDLILFGPVFEKRVGGELIQPGVGLPALEDAVRAAAGIPVLALGGITEESIPSLLATGASGAAAIRLFA
jgi:thiamine-phosphate pyrophosphorylase